MRDDTDGRRGSLGRLTIFLGVLQVAVGCIVGLVPPTAVPWFRGLVMAHVEFTGNGILLIALGLLLPRMRLGRSALLLWFASLQLGSWLNGAAGLVAGVFGRSSHLLSIANAASPPPGGAQDALVTGMLMATGVFILLALGLTLAGLARGWTPEADR